MHWALIIYNMPQTYGVLKHNQVRGEMSLLKNTMVIRQKKFFDRHQRREIMKEYMSICKLNTKNSYSIDIKLDV